jgi:PKD repeat protein
MKKIYLFCVFSILLCNTFYSQCMLYPVPMTSRVGNSSLIVHGQVVARKSFWNATRNYIYTSNLIKVVQVIKGQPAQYIEVMTDGGEVDLNLQVVEPSLQLVAGQEGVFMLNAFAQPSQYGYAVYQAHCDQQGFIRFDVKENKAYEPFKIYGSLNQELHNTLQKELNIRFPLFDLPGNNAKFTSSSSVAAITGISPTTITAGTSSTLTITGSAFGATQGTSFVEFENADDGGATYIQPHSSQYVSWSNTQIQVLVPTKASTVCGTAGTGQIRVTVAGSPTLSAQTLTVNHGEINVYYSTNNSIYNTRHVDLNAIGGITWQMYTGFNSSSAKAPFIRAFDTWRCNTLINWKLGMAVSTNTIALDNVNVIRFDVGAELPGGVLGRCTSYFGGCTSGPSVYFYISELDICFDDATTWQYGPANASGAQYDFESVAVHELGHGHQLSHVINTNDFMHYSIANGQNKRTPVSTNIVGGNNVMTRNLSGGVCTKPTMVALAAGQCSLVAPTASFNVTSPICVGNFLTLNDISTNGPTNWTWTMPGGAISSATTQNTSTSYSSPGIYTVSLVSTNGAGASATLSKTVSVVAIPTIVVSSNSVCAGSSATLGASGATSYTWNPGALTGATQTVSPTNTQVYTVLGSNGTCSNTANGTMSVIANPTVNINNASICIGSPTVMTASGATSYTWNPGALTGATQTLNPGGNATYTISGKTGNCNSAPKSFTITVNATPTINAVASLTFICTGQTTTLTASGAANYTFNPGGLTGNNVSVSPVTSTTYNVIGTTTAGCSGNTAAVTVSVSACTGIGELSNGGHFSVFPNPVKDKVTISFDKNFAGAVSVYNSLGQLMRSTKVDSNSLEIFATEYSSGIYIIKLLPENGKENTIKVIKE